MQSALTDTGTTRPSKGVGLKTYTASGKAALGDPAPRAQSPAHPALNTSSPVMGGGRG